MKRIVFISIAIGIFIFGLDMVLSDLMVHVTDIRHSAITAALFALIVFGILLLGKSLREMKKDRNGEK